MREEPDGFSNISLHITRAYFPVVELPAVNAA